MLYLLRIFTNVNYYFCHRHSFTIKLKIVLAASVHSNITATADFHQKNLNGTQAYDIIGELLQNGNFIFTWDDISIRKMVLTRNNGEILQAGYVEVNSNDWENPFAWEHGGYFITNFKGKRIKFKKRFNLGGL